MQIKKLRQVLIVPADFESAVRFYGETLGLTLQFRDGSRWAQFQAGEISVALAGPEEGMGAPSNLPVPVFEVGDLDAAVTELIAAGRAPGAIRDMGTHGRTAAVTDPAGTFLVFFQLAVTA